jgi:hypothetical protein
MTHETVRTSNHEIIEVTIPGSVDLVALARFTAATVAARAGFDLDEIDDLRLAVDELSISFGPLDQTWSLRFEFCRDHDTVTVRCTRQPLSDSDGSRQDLDAVYDAINWEQGRELSAQLLNELVTAHGRQIANGCSVAWLEKRRGGVVR